MYEKTGGASPTFCFLFVILSDIQFKICENISWVAHKMAKSFTITKEI